VAVHGGMEAMNLLLLLPSRLATNPHTRPPRTHLHFSH